MTGVLCIDFGTSSIRAAWQRSNRSVPDPLPIGRACDSRLDDASIKSDVHIDASTGIVCFGELAWTAGQKLQAAGFFESSPKLWLTRPRDLGQRRLPTLAVSRNDLLIWLIAFAIDASCKARRATKEELKGTDVRVAHPVWPSDVAREANHVLARITHIAKQVVLSGPFKAEIGVQALSSRVRDAASAAAPAEDVVEPIAAAVTLLPWDDNVRRVCAIVDIGAGTTDLGLFQVVAPDERTRVAGKLIPVGQPRSVYKAGNFLDDLVLELLLEGRTGKPVRSREEEVRRRIRQVKEALFTDEAIRELGVSVHLQTLAGHRKAKAMTREIRQALSDLVSQNASTVLDLMRAKTHSAKGLEVVLAGGGAGIPFIRDAMAKSLSVNGETVNVTLAERSRISGIHGADPERLAVAMGGANERYATLVREMKDQEGVIRRGRI